MSMNNEIQNPRLKPDILPEIHVVMFEPHVL